MKDKRNAFGATYSSFSLPLSLSLKRGRQQDGRLTEVLFFGISRNCRRVRRKRELLIRSFCDIFRPASRTRAHILRSSYDPSISPRNYNRYENWNSCRGSARAYPRNTAGPSVRGRYIYRYSAAITVVSIAKVPSPRKGRDILALYRAAGNTLRKPRATFRAHFA